MSMSQSLHKFTTQVPNIYFDVWMYYLSGSEMKVLSFLMRQTYGFQKPDASVGYAQMQIAEGLSKDGKTVYNGAGIDPATI